MGDYIDLYTDGGSRNNPGFAAIAAVLVDSQGKIIEKIGKFIGVATNNEAEYRALIEGLRRVLSFGVPRVNCYLDSLLVVKQMRGEYRIKEPRLQRLAREIKNLERNFDMVKYVHISRKHNSMADAIVNEILNDVRKNIS